MPVWLCWTTNIVAQLGVFFFAGIIFGWAPLELMLLREGQYSELCGDIGHPDEAAMTAIAATTTATADQDASNSATCPEQTNQLHGLFTLAQFWLSFSSLPVGYILDHLPKSMVLIICAAFQVSGLLLFAVSESSTVGVAPHADRGFAASGDFFALAYSLLAIGGCMTMLSTFPATFLLPSAQPLLLASISCLFDASSVAFYVFEELQEVYGTSRRVLFVGYAVWAVVLYSVAIGCWMLLERHDWRGYVASLSESASSSSAATPTSSSTPDIECTNGVGKDCIPFQNNAESNTGIDHTGNDKQQQYWQRQTATHDHNRQQWSTTYDETPRRSRGNPSRQPSQRK